MPKNEYVSNLADMREQLRRNYRNPEDITETPRMEIPRSAPPEKRSVRSEAYRDFRDLEGRVLSALAATGSELGRTEFYRNQLLERREKLDAVLKEMQTLSDGSEDGEYPRKVDALRYRYFEIAATEIAVKEGASEKERCTFRPETWVLTGAILAGALIVGACLLLSF